MHCFGSLVIIQFWFLICIRLHMNVSGRKLVWTGGCMRLGFGFLEARMRMRWGRLVGESIRPTRGRWAEPFEGVGVGAAREYADSLSPFREAPSSSRENGRGRGEVP